MPPLLPFLPVTIVALAILPVRADYAVESSTNLTDWTISAVSWPDVLEMARTNPATPGKPHYYYRLSPEPIPKYPNTQIPGQALVWNYVTNNFAGAVVRWASDPTNLVQVGENRWAINNPAMVFLVSPTATNVVASTTNLTEWATVSSSSSSSHPVAARHVAPPPALTVSSNTWSANLNWSPAAGIERQRLYWDVAPGSGRNQAELHPLENRYRLAGLTNGMSYVVELVSVAASGKESIPLRRFLHVEIKE